MPKLYHISDKGGIGRFHPQPVTKHHVEKVKEGVWAIEERLLHNYLLPRDCPRVTFYALPESHPEDVYKYMGHTTADYVVAVESAWMSAIQNTRLYLYELPSDTFTVFEEGAGYYLSQVSVMPSGVTSVDDLIGNITSRNVEFRIMPSLWDLCDAVVKSTLQFSMIRMRNAAPRKVSDVS